MKPKSQKVMVMSAAGMMALMLPGVVQAGHDSNILLERSWGIERNAAQLHKNYESEMRYSKNGSYREREAFLRAVCALTDESRRLSSDLQCSTPYSRLNDRVNNVNRYLREVNKLSGCLNLSSCSRGYLNQANNAAGNFNHCFAANGRSYNYNSYQPVRDDHNHNHGNSNDRDRDRDYRSYDNDRDRDYGNRNRQYDSRDGDGFYRMRASKAERPSLADIIYAQQSRR